MKNKLTSIFLVITIIVSAFSFSAITTSAADDKIGISSDNYLEITSHVTYEEIKHFIDSQSEDKLNSVMGLWVYLRTSENKILSEEGMWYIFDKIPNVETIDFWYVSNAKVEYVNNFSNLREVYFGNCGISDISPITNCPNLEKINFSDNKITDISPIAECPNLIDVDFKNNYITDITPIFSTGKIVNANFSKNHITNITGLKEYFSAHYNDIGNFYLLENPLKDQIDYLNKISDRKGKLFYDNLYSGSAFLSESDFRPLIYDDVTVDNENYTVTINSRVGASYVAINNVSANENMNFTVPKVEGKAELYVPTRYKFPKPADSNTYTTTLKAGSNKLAPVTYTLIVNFIEEAKPTFEVNKLTVKNATNTSFDAENSALTIDSEGTYVRVYKTLANGSTVKVNVDDYDFITEHDNFYHINKLALKTSDLNIASFEITTDSGDTISTKVNFPNAGILPLEKFKITNYDSLTIDGNEINIDIVDTKTYSRIFKTVSDGTTLTIESDNVYVEEREDCYVLRQRAVGATITMTYGENTYTINLTK